jgi:hypothetical protein
VVAGRHSFCSRDADRLVSLPAFFNRVTLLGALALTSVACQVSDVDDEEEASASDDTLRESLRREESAFDVDAFPQRAEWIDTYGKVPAGCVAQRDNAHAVFHGCYDWHSSVHAHWAVYRMSMTGTGRQRGLARTIDRRFTESEIGRVTTELDADRSFENPYGRAWLLHLASEHAVWNAREGRPSTRLSALAEHNARVLLDGFASRPPDPFSADYRSDAWTLAQVLLYGRATKQVAIVNEATALVLSTFVPLPVTWNQTNDDDPSSFMSTFWSSIYVISLALPASEVLAIVDPAAIPDDALTPLPDPGNREGVHQLGINWSRAWAIKALARHTKTVLGAQHPTTQRLVRAYHAHVHAGRERHFAYRGDYYAYDHWVPQFAIYAITDGAE